MAALVLRQLPSLYHVMRKTPIAVFAREGHFSAMVGQNTRRAITLLSATLTGVGSVIAYKLTESLDESQSWMIVGAWMVAGIIVTYAVSRLQARSQESSDVIKERVSQLEPLLRKQVQIRSYGARSKLIEAPLKELDLDITPRVEWVRDPRLAEPEPVSEEIAHDIVSAFETSKRRMLIVGDPGSGKTMAAYSLIEHLDTTESAEGRMPLLINLSSWEDQDNFEAFLVDNLCNPSVGYGVPKSVVAKEFVSSRRYSLILDGLDEIPAELRTRFSERLDEFVRGLPGEVGVVVTCRTQEYEELLAAHSTGLGLVQAVEILPLTSQQLDSAFVKLANRDKDWEDFLSQRHLTAYQRVRDLLSNPLLLNLAVAGHLSPQQLLDWTTTEQELRDLVLDRYLDRVLTNQGRYAPSEARRYFAWISRYLNGAEDSPFGFKTSDSAVFDLADLTPPEPPTLLWLLWVLIVGQIFGMVVMLGVWLSGNTDEELNTVVGAGQFIGGVAGVILVLVGRLLRRWTYGGSALSSRIILVWPSTRRQRRNFLRRAGRGAAWGLTLGLSFGLILGLIVTLFLGQERGLVEGLVVGLLFLIAMGLGCGLSWGLVGGLILGLVETRTVLITSRTPKEAYSRSLITALVGGLVFTLFTVVVWGLVGGLTGQLAGGLIWGLGLGLTFGLVWGMYNGGWFVLLQKVAYGRLTLAGNLPPRPYDFLEWGVEQQIFRRVGGGVRFRHNLIQQHLASTSAGAGE